MLTHPFTQLIEAYTGLQVRSQHTTTLLQTIQARMRALKFTTPEQYYQQLSYDIAAGGIVQFHPEWQQLIRRVMTGESYFFRDQGQLQLLRQQILPELIQQRRQQAALQQTKPTLRLWSAGCSTGEEAYSLAILVQQQLPDWRNWELLILGTDINEEAIAIARQARYHPWSFRMMSRDERSQYFKAEQGLWKLDETIRSLVTFRLGNLVQDAFPDARTDLYDMDLIVCRNVFIYFAADTIAAIIAKFSQSLKPDGYLMTGHAELHSQTLDMLSAQVFPESVVYRRSPTTLRSPTSLGSRGSALDDDDRSQGAECPTKHFSEDDSSPILPVLKDAEQQFQQEDYVGAIATAEAALAQAPQSLALHYFIAQCYVSLENYGQAKHHAQKMAERDALSTTPYYLLAYIAREQEEWEQAKAQLKRIIYLDPLAIAAYLELSALYAQEGNAVRAQKMQTTAMALMEQGTVNSEQGAGDREQGTGNREQGTGNRGQGTGSREQGAGNREQGTGSREQGTGGSEQGTVRQGTGNRSDYC